ncbi:MAG: cytochrome c3 family protein [Desulfosarcinaceae bacterium]|nr:cytochrome c3 family protein [Desulfosarcinaceae bacterium]
MLNRRMGFVMLIVIAATGFGLNIAIGSEAEEMTVPLGEIIIGPPEGVEPKRSPVSFPHGVHFDYACNQCHHMWEYDTEVQSCSTEGCHDAILSPIKAAAEGEEIEAYQYYKTAYHIMCISCHKEIKANNAELERTLGKLPDQLPATGPTGCIECHPKE